MIGPVVNSICIIAGAASGAYRGQIITPEVREKLNSVFSCLSLGMGVYMTAKSNALPPIILSLLMGTFLGEIFHLEKNIMRLAVRGMELLSRGKPQSSSLPAQVFRDQFAVVTVLFCMSSLGVLGSMHEGMSGDPSLLFIKSLLDLFTAMIFAANIGGVVGVLAVPQFSIQTLILLGATAIVPVTTPVMFANFTGCGGIIMLGTALRQFNLVQVPILNMLPGLFIVMPLTALWARILV